MDDNQIKSDLINTCEKCLRPTHTFRRILSAPLLVRSRNQLKYTISTNLSSNTLNIIKEMRQHVMCDNKLEEKQPQIVEIPSEFIELSLKDSDKSNNEEWIIL